MSVDNNSSIEHSRNIPKGDVLSLPKGWKETKLEDVCHKITDGSHQSPKAFKGGYLMLSVKDMNEFGFNIENSKTISKEDYIKLTKQGCKPEVNDILIAKDGSVLKHIFKVGKEIEGVLLSSIAIVKPNINLINPDYLVYLIVNPVFKKYILNNFLSGSGVPRIVLKDFKKIIFNLPPLPEQKAIAQILTSFDNKIENLQAQNKTLETTAQTIFKEWFGKYQINDELPDGWRVGKYADLVKLSSGKGIKKTEYIKDGKYEIIGANGILGCTDKFLINERIIITGRVGTLGTVFIINKPIWLSDNVLISTVKKQNLFYYSYFTLKRFNFKSLNSGSTQPLITQTDLKMVDIVIPTDNILNNFEKICNTIFVKIETNVTQIQTLKKTRDTLLPKLMSGQLRVAEFKV